LTRIYFLFIAIDIFRYILITIHDIEKMSEVQLELGSSLTFEYSLCPRLFLHLVNRFYDYVSWVHLLLATSGISSAFMGRVYCTARDGQILRHTTQHRNVIIFHILSPTHVMYDPIWGNGPANWWHYGISF
jgi:hypothetical protein